MPLKTVKIHIFALFYIIWYFFVFFALIWTQNGHKVYLTTLPSNRRKGFKTLRDKFLGFSVKLHIVINLLKKWVVTE